MTYTELKRCLKQTNFSAEVLAPYFSVSNMTFRRWEKNKSRNIDSKYESAIINGLFLLVAEGHLSMDSEELQSLISKNWSSSAYFNSVVKTLGISADVSSQESFEARVVDCLYEIGGEARRRQYVESKLIKVSSKCLKKLGSEFGQRVTSLRKIIQSTKEIREHRIAAYGALFYFFIPFDFIPDHLPIFGLLDDFAVLGFAMTHYKILNGK
ncbi:MAG: YkvA family protein [Pseudobdellovibrionaceae bacterium]